MRYGGDFPLCEYGNIIMARVISIHEYKLKRNVTSEQFENAVENARNRSLFNLPGLIDYHFLKRLRGRRQTDYAAIWVYQDKESWERLWGTINNPNKKEDYPEQWKIWENEILAPLLSEEPDHIYYAAYEEL